jgi:hypothetical protein
MRGLTGDDLLKLPVRLHGIELARPVDIVVDTEGRRAVGLELLCGDHARRFLPLGAATLTADEIALDSALAVLDDGAFYRERGHALSALRGVAVSRNGHEEGHLDDVVVGDDGELVALVLGERQVPFTAELKLDAATATRSAA